ncbi:MAG: GNAT family N-acetyltransferase [Acidobacteria bacterium]|nr:GNAT family N-acetyltransferase [Acidobacteriota bacterium]
MQRPSFRPAAVADLDTLLPLLRSFYEHFGYPFDEAVKKRSVKELISDPSLGFLTLIEVEERTVGYAVVAFSFSLEYEGKTAFLDELFISRSCRGLGIGSAAIAHVASTCRSLGVNALHLETEETNTGAADLYARSGFRSYGRHLMTRILSGVPGPKP